LRERVGVRGRGIKMNRHLTTTAKILRKRSTNVEILLWRHLTEQTIRRG